ncbi:MAG: DUF1549 and DUF1553 domain-containing protein [Isosphaeraceae bacterium]|nr:DUF1549 and DUF1553 domain-containing protein [Isosphaeraceae bacterium]
MASLRPLLPTAVALLAAWTIVPANAADVVDPTPRKATRLLVVPESVELSTVRDRQGFVAQAEYSDGSTLDVTARVRTVIQGASATVSEGILAPAAEGGSTLEVEFEGLKATARVEVRDPARIPVMSFRNDVMPIFTKAGCNTGKCHGSASGKDGFRLSLFGYDPAGDHYRLTREALGRRVDLYDPASSLLLGKALGRVTHTGGRKIIPGSENHDLLVRWLELGAPVDPADAPVPTSIDVSPALAVFSSPADAQRIIVRARYSDGTDRDVTRFTVFSSNNEGAVAVDEDGTATGKGPGEAFILARFDQFTSGLPIIVRPGTPFRSPGTPANNQIDVLVNRKLDRLHLLPSELCDDETYLRRVTIDLIGRLPTPEERRGFLADERKDKRRAYADSLIHRDEFDDVWVMKWAELLQIRTINGISPKGLQLYDRWLRDRVRSGVTIDRIARELIPAVGGTFENPAVNYFQTETTPQIIAENVAQVFLGTRIQCAQCHNHPFDRWTLDDYYGFASFFSRIGYKQARDPRELTIFSAGTGEVKHPIAGRTVRPTFLGGGAPEIPAGEDFRTKLADWLVSKENPAFARNLANLVWAHFFGQGIIDPVDDARVSNPPSNAELLDALAARLVEAKYDVAELVREIVGSRTYQLSTRRNDSNRWDERNFSHQRVRRMRAEVLLDCITQVTETTNRFPGLPLGGRAVQIPDGRAQNYFLTTFGRASRDTACSCEVKTTPTLSQALHLINGETTTGKISEGEVVPRLLARLGKPEHVAEALYERCLSRLPTTEESARISAKLAEAGDPKESLEDLFWALLNANEFLFNH